MKKKILSLILVLMLVPFASLFSACGKDKGYNLNNLQTDFNAIEKENNNLKLEDGKLIFDYSAQGNLQTVIDSTAPYTELNDYNYVFENMMRFASSYVGVCSNNSAIENIEIKNQVQADLEDFKKSVGDVNQCFNLFAEMILVSQSDLTSTSCLNRFENLLKTYDTMFEKGRRFNNTLANLYFNNILNDGNPNVYAIGETNFNANVVVNKIRSRIEWQISNLSSSFVEMYVDANLATDIVNNSKDFELSKFGYETNIKNLLGDESQDRMGVDDLIEVNAIERANNSKSNFYKLSVQAQNIQSVLNSDNSKYVYACAEIDYTVVILSDVATAHEKMCASIIEDNYNSISTYNNVLSLMLDIMLERTGA